MIDLGKPVHTAADVVQMVVLPGARPGRAGLFGVTDADLPKLRLYELLLGLVVLRWNLHLGELAAAARTRARVEALAGEAGR